MKHFSQSGEEAVLLELLDYLGFHFLGVGVVVDPVHEVSESLALFDGVYEEVSLVRDSVYIPRPFVRWPGQSLIE